MMMPAAAVTLAVLVAAMAVRPRRHRGTNAETPVPSRLDQAVTAGAAWRHRRQTPNARHVASWCDDVVRRVRSGSTLREALSETPEDATTARATVPLRVGIERGLPIPDAAKRVGDAGPHIRLALAVIVSTSRIGGPAAASIDRTAVVLRQRAADLEDRATHAAQARLSTHVMTAIPVLMLAVLAATDDDVRSVVTSPIGSACIAGGLALNALGWWWMNRIVRAQT